MNNHFINKRMAHLLGFAGVAPFVLLALACWTVHPDWLGDFIKGQLAYSIAFLPFLGGIHWGAVLTSPLLSSAQTKKSLLCGVVPSLLAWLATMLGGYGFAALIVGFVGAYLVDKHMYLWYRMPPWFIKLRFMLTCIVVAALVLTVIAANVRG